MRRRIAIALASACMLVMSTCVTFAVPGGYTVYVAGVEMTVMSDGAAAYYVNGVDGSAGVVTDTEPADWNGKLWYDAGEGALVFEMRGLDVAEKGIKSGQDITMVIKGDNNVKGTTEKSPFGSKSYGVYVDGTLNISDKSDGVLVVRADDVEDNSMKSDFSRGLYAAGRMIIGGGTIKAYGGSAIGDLSYGIGAYDGVEILGGDVTAVGGPATYSVGLYSDLDIVLGGDAVVRAETVSGQVDGYSYGTFVYGDLLVKEDAYFESVAGATNDEATSAAEKRCYGIYLGELIGGSNDTSHAGGMDKLQILGGTVIAKGEGSGSHAVVFYDADRIEFVGDGQDDEHWYQWKINEGDKMTASSVAAYPDADKWQSTTGYFHVEPVSEESPDTGDNNTVAAAMVGMLLAVMGVMITTRKIYRE